jgi:outer membrane lipoprotein LolB
MILIAGCAVTTRPGGKNESQNASYFSGRIVVRIDANPPQQFAAEFELRGASDAGELALSTPFGNTLARLAWDASGARLQRGDAMQQFASIDDLTQAAVGAPVPLPALFDWLSGRATQVTGWKADLGAISSGRLVVSRESPPPTVLLQVQLSP